MGLILREEVASRTTATTTTATTTTGGFERKEHVFKKTRTRTRSFFLSFVVGTTMSVATATALAMARPRRRDSKASFQEFDSSTFRSQKGDPKPTANRAESAAMAAAAAAGWRAGSGTTQPSTRSFNS
jgi:hypothetical protein